MFDFHNALGNSCHQRKQSQVAICVVTGLNHNEILFAHIPTDNTKWVITGATWSLQRFWTTSTLEFTVMCAQEYITSFMPPMPVVNKGEGNKAHPLQPEDEICIWSGYVDQLYINPEDLPKLMEGEHPHLIRSYVGVVDTISYVGTDRGLKCTFACRDRMRYLMDTHVSLLPFDTNNSTGYMNQALGGSTSSVNRSQVILRLAQTGIGYVRLGTPGAETPLNIYGKRIEAGLIQDIGEFIGQQTQTPRSARVNPKNFLPSDYLYNHGLRPLASSTLNRFLDINPTPLFNIFTSRPPFNTETVTREYTLEEQIPIEIIKHLSNQEVYPTEVFSSAIDGNYYYVPRGGDLSGLNDPRRFYRTYYYRYTPPGLGNVLYLNKIKSTYGFGDVVLKDEGNAEAEIAPTNTVIDYLAAFAAQPDYGQAVLSFKHDLTTVSMFTNFIVSNSSPNNKAEGGGDNILINMSARPAFLSGLDIAGRNKYIVDETINTPSEATAVAVNYARLHSKEVRAMQITIPGDPSLQPGEVIQLIGNPMFEHLRELPELIRERKAAYDFMAKDNANYQDILKTIKDQDGIKTTSYPLAVTGNNEPASEHICQDPNQDCHVLGRIVKGTKSALEVLGAPYFDQSSTIIKAGKGAPENVALDAKSNSTPAPTGSSAGVPTADTQAAASTSDIEIKTESAFYFPAQRRYETTSRFGMRTHPITGRRRLHAGMDIGAPLGANIVASRSGVVKSVLFDPPGYGNYIIIDHGNGLQTLYGHLLSVSVRVGQPVRIGEVIGKCGSTGGSTGPHLHFEIIKNGTKVNPEPELKRNSQGQYILATQVKPAEIGTQASTIPTAPTPAVKTNTQVTPPASALSSQYADIASKTGYVEAYTEISKANLKLYQGHQVATVTADAFELMRIAAARDGVSLKVLSGFRSVADQTTIWNEKGGTIQAAQYSAPPGYSQHHTGLAVDINSLTPEFKNTPAFTWLSKNAPTYGFMLPYGVSKGDLGPNPEPWHWVYVGDAASMRQLTAFITRAKELGYDPLLGNAKLETLYNSTKDPAITATSTTAPTASTSTVAGTPVADELYKRSHFAQEPVSMFRVDAVRHNYNSAGSSGYTTEVVLLPLFGG